ncbi:MAG: asparagine synthase (glutamine-hydrolyzing) [Labilithrix sp.]|nr:asparagine synthase (glutamine-hydrolyzing) [Labilithrix sp.]MCW5835809.1 asparagine synthase (glutamine-hydrolyzing) [Labilithrix sp.]
MCGIVGVLGLEQRLDHTQALVSAMADRIRHRGPDGGGVVTHPDATIGMTRLAIVDVPHGHQPMANDDESVFIVYNGEIYNAPALRSELEGRGVRFRTRSDTEVILRLYEEDPERVEERLVGMWAFAIHDRRRRRVVLSRDRFGIKPLFVADAGAALAFASELRCFDRSAEPFARLFGVDHDAAHAMVSWSYIPESGTIYEGVRRLAPATRLTVDLESGRRETRSYWTLEPSEDASRVKTLDEACEHVDALLRRAVKEHLESDVPIATFLSGGIDSSLVTAYAHEVSNAPIKAYSIGFTESYFDESPFARRTAEKIGVPINVETFDEDKARAKLPDALLAYDEPFGDSSSLATYLLSHHVARDFKVALGGDGGDEVFAGYKKYMVVRLRRPFLRAPRLRDALGGALGRVPVRHDRTKGWSELLRTVRRVARGLEGPAAHVYTQLTQVAPLARTEILMRRPASARRFEEEAHARFERALGTELQKSLACDLGSMLCNDMLVKVDRASMACSLEARVPFLDHRVAEFGVGLPETYTLGASARSFSGKRVLRTLHERRFGPELARRKKHGFGVPVEKWLRGPFDGACERLFDERRLDRFGILSSAELSGGRFRRWVATDPWILWHAFALASWCEATLGDGPDALREMLSSS